MYVNIPVVSRYSHIGQKMIYSMSGYVPATTLRIVEPFSHMPYFSVACAQKGFTKKFMVNCETTYAELLRLIIDEPNALSDFYEKMYSSQFKYENEGKKAYDMALEYYKKEEDITQKAIYFLFILSKSKYNLTYNCSTYGKSPNEMESVIKKISTLLKDRTEILSNDVDRCFNGIKENDTFFIDIPIDTDMDYLTDKIYKLQEKNIFYILTTDSKTQKNKKSLELLTKKLECVKKEEKYSKESYYTFYISRY